MAVDASAIAATGSSVATSRRRDLIDLSVGYTLILLVIWTPNPWQKPLYLATILWVVLSTCISFDGWRPMGLHVSNPFRPLWIIAASLTLAIIAIAVAARLHTLRHFESLPAFLQRYWGYAIFAFAQQFLLQDFFLLRLLRLLPTRTTAVVAASTLFALAHLPNPILTPITIVWGLAACLLFLRYRNIYPSPSHTPSSAYPSPSPFPAPSTTTCVSASDTSPIAHTLSITAATATISYPPRHA